MSLFGSMTTAITGLNAQARALGHVSDNVANSQTAGFKRIDTSFVSYLTESTQSVHRSGSVVARPDYTHTISGPIAQSENPLSLAISPTLTASYPCTENSSSAFSRIFCLVSSCFILSSAVCTNDRLLASL